MKCDSCRHLIEQRYARYVRRSFPNTVCLELDRLKWLCFQPTSVTRTRRKVTINRTIEISLRSETLLFLTWFSFESFFCCRVTRSFVFTIERHVTFLSSEKYFHVFRGIERTQISSMLLDILSYSCQFIYIYIFFYSVLSVSFFFFFSISFSSAAFSDQTR